MVDLMPKRAHSVKWMLDVLHEVSAQVSVDDPKNLEKDAMTFMPQAAVFNYDPQSSSNDETNGLAVVYRTVCKGISLPELLASRKVRSFLYGQVPDWRNNVALQNYGYNAQAHLTEFSEVPTNIELGKYKALVRHSAELGNEGPHAVEACRVIVDLQDATGKSKVSQFVTPQYVREVIQDLDGTIQNAGGLYFIPQNMVVVKSLTKEVVRKTLEDLILTGAMDRVFRTV